MDKIKVKDYKKGKRVLLICFIIQTILCWIVIGITFKQQLIIEDSINCERMRLYNKDLMESTQYTNGLYFANSHYCVWVKDRELVNVEKTDVHEQCHHLVAYDYEHFCLSNTSNSIINITGIMYFNMSKVVDYYGY